MWLALLLAASLEEACTGAASITGDDAATVAELRALLERSGVSTQATRGCRAVDAALGGVAAPYHLTVIDASLRRREWRLHRLELAAAMIEAALGLPPAAPRTIVREAPPPEPRLPPIILAIRGEAVFDGAGANYFGPGVTASYCPTNGCLDLSAHAGWSAGLEARTDVSVALGASIRPRKDDWSFGFALGLGVRWTRLALQPRLSGSSGATAWPFAAHEESEALGMLEVDVTVARSLGAGLELGGAVALQLMPSGGDVSAVGALVVSAPLVARAGLLMRWDLPEAAR